MNPLYTAIIAASTFTTGHQEAPPPPPPPPPVYVVEDREVDPAPAVTVETLTPAPPAVEQPVPPIIPEARADSTGGRYQAPDGADLRVLVCTDAEGWPGVFPAASMVDPDADIAAGRCHLA